MNRWEQGRPVVDQLLSRSRLTKVAPNRELAESYIAQAKVHLSAAEAIRDIDPPGAFQLTYDAARKTLASILINQGLRPRGEGAHAVLIEVVVAQLEPPRQTDFRNFDWMRRVRNDTEYPDVGRPSANVDDLAAALPSVKAMIDRATQLIPHMPPY